MLRLRGRPKEVIIKQTLVVKYRQDLLSRKLGVGLGGLSYLKKYAGCSNCIGANTRTNSFLVQIQLMFALAANFHPNVNKLIRALKVFTNNYHSEIETLLDTFLIEEKAFKGIRVLDLGCGDRPSFGRVLRAMGAEVYTVDLMTANDIEFRFYRGGFDQSARDLEVMNHISCNLGLPDSTDLLLQKTGGKFDLVTSAYLDLEWGRFGPVKMGLVKMLNNLLPKILREFGIYFHVTIDANSRMFLGEEGFLNLDIIWNPHTTRHELKAFLSPNVNLF